ncbi:MAG: LptF/LptG family permease [Candidatus Cloacimonadaceae bacterium]|nr:LptF/LptG family permease [Candidatus Cloacimonadaceae bacterium]
MKILSRYILKEHVVPFMLSLLVVTFVLLIDRVIDLLDLILEKKLDAATILQVFTLSLPYMLALSIPMAVLVATILAFGRMTVDRETIAMKSSGINVYAMIRPLLITALLLTALMVYFNHWFLPNTNHKLKNLMIKIAYFRPMTIIKEGEFTTLMDYTVYVKNKSEDELYDLLIYDRSQTTLPRIIVAQSGRVIQKDNGNSLQLILKNGEMHERNAKEPAKYQLREFENFVVNIRNLGANMDFGETGYRSDREMTYGQLMTEIKDKKKEISLKLEETGNLDKRIASLSQRRTRYELEVEKRRLSIMKKMAEDRISELEENLHSLKVEFHKKFALSFAIVIFILIGIPLGLMTRSSGIGMAFSVSSVVFLIYYIALTGGEQLADRGLMSPFLSMWISNLVFLALAIGLIYASVKEKQLINLRLLSWRMTHLKLRKESVPDELIH